MHNVEVANFTIGECEPLAVFSGPCVIEDEDHCLRAAARLTQIFSERNINFVFKSSYDKANRSSLSSFRGPGLDEGLRILERVKAEYDVPVVTDVHSPQEARAAAEVCDVVQIPAFLCRQTDLVIAAGGTGKVILVKKGQFMAPWDMINVVDKIRSTGNNKIILIDRGTMFGYNNLISDMRAIPVMQSFGCPVCFDASHSVQLPGGQGATTGGQREYIPILARAAVAAGCNSLFVESHPEPLKAKSDATSVLAFEDLIKLLDDVAKIYRAINEEC